MRNERDEARAEVEDLKKTVKWEQDARLEQERMLRLAAIRKYRRKSHQDEWLADLRARAEEGSE
jgi:vancomycin resistance protein YoaR